MAPPKNKTVERDQGPMDNVDPTLAAEMKRAIAASQSRLEAPQVSVTARENPMKEFIWNFAPETVGRDAKWHSFTDDPVNHSMNIAQGYIPVPDPVTGKQAVGPGGVRLYKIPMELHRRNLATVKARSDSILRKTAKEQSGVKKDEHGQYGIVTEQVSIATGSSIEEAAANAEAELAGAV